MSSSIPYYNFISSHHQELDWEHPTSSYEINDSFSEYKKNQSKLLTILLISKVATLILAGFYVYFNFSDLKGKSLPSLNALVKYGYMETLVWVLMAGVVAGLQDLYLDRHFRGINITPKLSHDEIPCYLTKVKKDAVLSEVISTLNFNQLLTLKKAVGLTRFQTLLENTKAKSSYGIKVWKNLLKLLEKKSPQDTLDFIEKENLVSSKVFRLAVKTFHLENNIPFLSLIPTDKDYPDRIENLLTGLFSQFFNDIEIEEAAPLLDFVKGKKTTYSREEFIDLACLADKWSQTKILKILDRMYKRQPILSPKSIHKISHIYELKTIGYIRGFDTSPAALKAKLEANDFNSSFR